MATKEIRSPAFVRPTARIQRAAVPRTNVLVALLPVLLLFYAAMLPAEVRLVIAGQSLYAPRLVGFAVLPIVLYRMLRDPIRWSFWDGIYVFGGFWMIIAFMANYGPGEGIRRGFALAFDTLIPFLAARLCIRSLDDLRRFLIFAAPGLALVAGSLIAEVLAGRLLVKPFFASFFGSLASYEEGVAVGTKGFGTETRLGIIRAPGPFAHPILAGAFLATLVPLYFYAGIRRWPKFVGLFAGACSVLSVSSTAIVALLVGIGVIIADFIQRMVSFLTWKIIIPAVAMLAVLLHLGTENGLVAYLTQFTLNPQTARYRRRIWEYGMQSVENNPWFGIGFKTYERIDWMVVDSVDAHWLMLAIRFGFIPSIAILAVALAAMIFVGSAAGRARNKTDRNAYVAVIACTLTMLMAGMSVAFFGGVETWFYMIIGIGMSLGMAAKGERLPVLRPGDVIRPSTERTAPRIGRTLPRVDQRRR